MNPIQKARFGASDGQTYHWTGEAAAEAQVAATAMTMARTDYTLDFIGPFEVHNKDWVRAEGPGQHGGYHEYGLGHAPPGECHRRAL